MREQNIMTRIWSLLCLAALLTACQAQPAPESDTGEPVTPLTAPTDEAPAIPKAQVVTPAPAKAVQPVVPAVANPEPAVPLPENVELQNEYLFAMDTDQEEYELTLHGISKYKLIGRLADDQGRREIILRGVGADDKTETVLFKADWLLPAVGAVNSNGNMLVCVNRLVGRPTALTKGTMPDPNAGVDLVCRMYNGQKWMRETKLDRLAAANWLNEVIARRDGNFWVSYSLDQSGRMVDDPVKGDAMYRVPFRAGRFGDPKPARRFRLPTEK